MVGDLPWIEDGGTSMRSFGHGVLSCCFEHRSVVDPLLRLGVDVGVGVVVVVVVAAVSWVLF